ncbi:MULTISPECIES: L-histidine N(alpha)-methyltransferase [Actinomadura]|uniref:Histidine N-alpha-methyltransferase n=1 Tax=Actinomadura litoris TaxID=2678616 RepID=A0A7K1LD95_9ACTN|nr:MULTISPECIES: L-histidine N(alpha)-methyltransferase [Actinomadura]MBT2208346.1 L-histidine N(alpha)-methyltransferase [Actinomadura sp. NEAU-AAG7]MUN42388.1 L-histidine N(alpha)-methyltransferase [Actinomadura litoris]
MDRFLTADDLAKTLRLDVREGLAGTPKTLPSKWFYDERGSALFEEITKLEEYYPTRREREILVTRAPDIAAATGARTLLELGAGSGEKTRVLLDALNGTLRSYVPVDVSGDFLEEAAAGIAADHPDLTVHAVVADYEQHLHLLPTGERRLVAFLGGTIGNMPPATRVGFLGGLRATMGEGDFLLLGADLVKDTGRLVRAYDDAAGVTADFNRNVLRVINRELGADFDPDAFEHVARWDAAEEWIEMRLRSTRDQDVSVPGLDLAVSFAEGEEMRTEISSKFRRERMEAELGAAGLETAAFWTDAADDFCLVLARPALD